MYNENQCCSVNYLMSQALQTSLFQEALNAVELLSVDDQTALLDVLHNRLKLRHREQVVQEIREVQQEYREGKFKSGSVDDFLAELSAI
jgi:hypothetical protein